MKERGNRWLRRWDRILGIPLVFFLGLIRKKQTNIPSSLQRIALLKTAGIGDIVLLTAIIQDLKKAFPHTAITLYTGSSNEEMGHLIEGISIAALPIKHPLKSLKIIRKYPYDLWLDFGPWPRINAILSHFARARFKVGFKSKNQFRHYVYDQAVEHKETQHELENFRDILRSLHIPVLHFPFVNIEEKKVPQRIILHPFPGGFLPALREWPNENWYELLNYLSKQNFELFLTGAPQDQSRIDLLIQQCSCKNHLNNAAGKRSLKETAFLLKTANLVISVDTGIMHLAAAIGTPVISLHGPTPPTRWGAIGQEVHALTCCHDFLNCHHRKQKTSIQHISVDRVINAIWKMPSLRK